MTNKKELYERLAIIVAAAKETLEEAETFAKENGLDFTFEVGYLRNYYVGDVENPDDNEWAASEAGWYNSYEY